jgi:large subunit ribosomal protein L32e
VPDDPPPSDTPAPAAAPEAAPAAAPPRRRSPRPRAAAPAKPAEAAKPETPPEAPRAPRRGELPPERQRLLTVRRAISGRRPIFGRQAANRYARIGRDLAWRRPRGLQSKQRRHYGYRAEIVSIGYRSPSAVRGLTPSGFAPVVVRNRTDLEAVDARREAAVIARTIGTRLRLVLEERARQLGIHVLNPIVKAEREE